MDLKCSPALWCVGPQHTNLPTRRPRAITHTEVKAELLALLDQWDMCCSHELTQPSPKCCFQTQSLGSFDNVSDQYSPVQQVCPRSYLSLPLFSSFQARRSTLMAHQLQALAPQVALPCQVGKWHCSIILAITGNRKDLFLS